MMGIVWLTPKIEVKETSEKRSTKAKQRIPTYGGHGKISIPDRVVGQLRWLHENKGWTATELSTRFDLCAASVRGLLAYTTRLHVPPQEPPADFGDTQPPKRRVKTEAYLAHLMKPETTPPVDPAPWPWPKSPIRKGRILIKHNSLLSGYVYERSTDSMYAFAETWIGAAKFSELKVGDEVEFTVNDRNCVERFE